MQVHARSLRAPKNLANNKYMTSKNADKNAETIIDLPKTPENDGYKVLARAYRPQHFGELIGQDVLVRTLTNAIDMNRVAQAYMMTGVRGVGKTTTARIIAKSLNYPKGPTAGPTDDDPLCQAITAGNHPDVLEIDAASNTGVDKMRDLLETVQYAPMEARYKVYIIDEVHMLSTAAFNALLKTLEEPPSHVIFIFATTEIRKVPVTILSRCQRFDLKRVSVETLAAHMKDICAKENAAITENALNAIARAADGSVRDALSLLDRAIALATGAEVNEALIKDMLGLSDQRAVFDLWSEAVTGKTTDALARSDDMRQNGADPARLINDLCSLTHRAIRAKVGAPHKDDASLMKDIIEVFSLPALNRAWSLCLQGIKEINNAPDPSAAFDLTLIRLAYAATLPDPGKLIKALHDQSQNQNNAPQNNNGGSNNGGSTAMLKSVAGGGSQVAHAVSEPVHTPQIDVTSLEDVVAFAEAQNEPRLAAELKRYVHLVSLKKGVLEIYVDDEASKDVAGRISGLLKTATGHSWMVPVSRTKPQDAQSITESTAQEFESKRKEMLDNRLVRDILEVFPGAELISIEDKEN